MPGEWIKNSDNHECEFPVYHRGNGVTTGDVWLCNDCDKRWSVVVYEGYDPRPGEGMYGWYDWKKLRNRK